MHQKEKGDGTQLEEKEIVILTAGKHKKLVGFLKLTRKDV